MKKKSKPTKKTKPVAKKKQIRAVKRKPKSFPGKVIRDDLNGEE